MKIEKKSFLVLIFTIFYTILFIFLAIRIDNMEFVFYILFESIILIFLILYYKKVHLSLFMLVLISLLLFMHFAGGNFFINGTRLYDVMYKDIIRYDNIVHFLWGFVFTFIAYNILVPHLDKKVKHNSFLFAAILVLITSGGGALVEIQEFLGVVFFEAAKGVGSYVNNALDLVYNSIGAIIASIILVKYHRKIKK